MSLSSGATRASQRHDFDDNYRNNNYCSVATTIDAELAPNIDAAVAEALKVEERQRDQAIAEALPKQPWLLYNHTVETTVPHCCTFSATRKERSRFNGKKTKLHKSPTMILFELVE
jgi:hypothetical protein